ncbi:Uncharacterised protein [Vibrio cholerae]|nr:Uncharacterised protein [Vibrio cholerae]CSI51475.1 Uncharacterised protein [Vibrio cholerae]
MRPRLFITYEIESKWQFLAQVKGVLGLLRQ